MPYNAEPLTFYSREEMSDPLLAEAQNAFLKRRWIPIHSLLTDTAIYHYTNEEGVRGILDSRSMWHSHVTSMNDPQELIFGRSIIWEALDEFAREVGGEDNVIELVGELKNVMIASQALTHHAYVSCFCGGYDLLSQWRGYGGQGVGYCLGFLFNDRTKLTPNPEHDGLEKKIALRKVIYRIDDQKTIVKDYMFSTWVSVRDVIAEPMGEGRIPSWRRRGLPYQLANPLIDMMISFKHPGFEEEREWRSVYVSAIFDRADTINFRSNPPYFTPYRNLYVFDELEDPEDSHHERYVKQFPVVDLIYGPGLDPIRASVSLRLYARKTSTINSPIIVNPDLTVAGSEVKLRV